jgi:SAM-dependent methyltransferase
MLEKTDRRLIRASAEKLYGAGQKIWHANDPWNAHVRKEIDKFGRKYAKEQVANASQALDVGCGSESYGWLPETRISTDRFEAQLKNVPNPMVADVEDLPLETQSVDFIVCVGAVLNYASAAEAIAELARVSQPGGFLLLQFETSTSFEHVLTKRWGAPAMRIETVNAVRAETLWVYNPRYIFDLLSTFGFEVVVSERFHVLSALGLRLGMGQQRAARLAHLDRAFQWCGRFADDVILLAQKRGEVADAAVKSADKVR